MQLRIVGYIIELKVEIEFVFCLFEQKTKQKYLFVFVHPIVMFCRGIRPSKPISMKSIKMPKEFIYMKKMSRIKTNVKVSRN